MNKAKMLDPANPFNKLGDKLDIPNKEGTLKNSLGKELSQIRIHHPYIYGKDTAFESHIHMNKQERGFNRTQIKLEQHLKNMTGKEDK